jgi:hypothetical protein
MSRLVGSSNRLIGRTNITYNGQDKKGIQHFHYRVRWRVWMGLGTKLARDATLQQGNRVGQS